MGAVRYYCIGLVHKRVTNSTMLNLPYCNKTYFSIRNRKKISFNATFLGFKVLILSHVLQEQCMNYFISAKATLGEH